MLKNFISVISDANLFSPTLYIVSVKGETWICETKGGFDKSGMGEDIDLFTHKKCEVLQTYLAKHKVRGGLGALQQGGFNGGISAHFGKTVSRA